MSMDEELNTSVESESSAEDSEETQEEEVSTPSAE